jgi:hypothetical protein
VSIVRALFLDLSFAFSPHPSAAHLTCFVSSCPDSSELRSRVHGRH